MNKNIIELQNINTIYEGEKRPVIKGINLSVKTGEFVCIIGPNGAGKTTLLETINGLLPYTGGKGFVFGKEIKKNKSFIRKKTGYLIQNFEIGYPISPSSSRYLIICSRFFSSSLLQFFAFFLLLHLTFLQKTR